MIVTIGLVLIVAALPANTVVHRIRRGRWTWTYEEQFKLN